MQSVLSTSWEIPHKFYEKAYKQVDVFHQVGFLVCGDLSDFPPPPPSPVILQKPGLVNYSI